MLGSYLVRVRSDLPDGEVAGALEEVDTGATAVFHSGAELLRLLSLGIDAARRSPSPPGEPTAPQPPRTPWCPPHFNPPPASAGLRAPTQPARHPDQPAPHS